MERAGQSTVLPGGYNRRSQASTNSRSVGPVYFYSADRATHFLGEVSSPLKVGLVSHSLLQPVATYIHRPLLHEKLKQGLGKQIQNNQSTIVVVYGLGGTGKSQLVLNYLREHGGDYDAVLWIDASCKATLERDFVRIWRMLFPGQSAMDSSSVSVENSVTEVKNWFHTRSGRWLVIFDGADAIDDDDDNDDDDNDDEKGNEWINLRHYTPNASSVCVVVTTRNSMAVQMSTQESVEVAELSEEEGTELLRKCVGLQPGAQSTSAKLIVRELGNLALAINLAGFYISESPNLKSDIEGYLIEYRKQRQRCLAERPIKVIHYYAQSVMTTWETSFSAIQMQSPVAAQLLNILAFLNFDDVYLNLFEESSEKGNVVVVDDEDEDEDDDSDNHQDHEQHMEKSRRRSSLLEKLSSHNDSGRQLWMNYSTQNKPGRYAFTWRGIVSSNVPWHSRIIVDAMRVLQRYSFVKWVNAKKSYSIHKLVHAWAHDRLSIEERRTLSFATLGMITHNVKGQSSRLEGRLRLLPHVTACLRGAIDGRKVIKREYSEVLQLVDPCTDFLRELGRVQEESWNRAFLAKACSELYGRSHPDTLLAMSNLARNLKQRGELGKATDLHRTVLKRMRSSLGEKFHWTISTMENLADCLQLQGELEEATEMLQRVADNRRKTLGAEHPNTLTSMQNLAISFAKQGKLGDASRIQSVVIEKAKKILGDEDPNFLVMMQNMAVYLASDNDLDKAIGLEQHVLEKRLKFCGTAHVATLTVKNNLANMLYAQHKVDQAVELQLQVVEKRREILGPKHVQTVKAEQLLFKMQHSQEIASASVFYDSLSLEKPKHVVCK